MDLINIISIVGFVVLIGIVLVVIYLNSLSDTTSKELIRFLTPFGLYFDKVHKDVFATGVIDKSLVAFNAHPKGDGQEMLIKMQTRIDLPHAPNFYLANLRARDYLKRNAASDPDKWIQVKSGFYLHARESELQPEAIDGCISAQTKTQFADFDTTYGGVVVYTLDQTLFPKHDADLIKALPELANEMLLLTFIKISKKVTEDQFREFVSESVQLAQALEHDFKTICPAPDEETQNKRLLTLKRFQKS